MPRSPPRRRRPNPPRPTSSPALPDSSEEESPSGGSGSGLTLRRAEATGHAVWLQSKAQGLTARCNELIHKKFTPEQADETYFRGDVSSRLQVEKLDIVPDGPDKGKIQSVTTIRTTDAAIFDDGQDKNNATVVARGPGILEIRPARDRPVERKATWDDQLILQTEEGASGKVIQKKITLTRNPRLIDLTQGTLDARSTIIVWLKPKPTPATPGGATRSSSGSASESYQIDMLKALDRVHLAAPGRTMDARDFLEVKFESRPPVASSNPSANPNLAPVAAAEPAPPAVQPPVEGNPLAETKPELAEKPSSEPDVVVKANRVWAKLLLHPKEGVAPEPRDLAGIGDSKTEIQMVFLRGAVDYHQDPAPGKQRGTDVTGDALDVIGQGDGKSKFTVYHRDPYASKLAPAQLALLPPARVVTEEFITTGQKIGLDQKIDQAWVDGPGTLTQMAKRGLLTDKGLDDPAGKVDAKAPPDAPTAPMTISWQQAMRFYGRPPSAQDPAVARAEFYADVRAEMEDSLLVCQEMKSYMDRTVTLTRPKPDPNAPPTEPEPKPQIAWIDCLRRVTAITRKVDPATQAPAPAAADRGRARHLRQAHGQLPGRGRRQGLPLQP